MPKRTTESKAMSKKERGLTETAEEALSDERKTERMLSVRYCNKGETLGRRHTALRKLKQ